MVALSLSRSSFSGGGSKPVMFGTRGHPTPKATNGQRHPHTYGLHLKVMAHTACTIYLTFTVYLIYLIVLLLYITVPLCTYSLQLYEGLYCPPHIYAQFTISWRPVLPVTQWKTVYNYMKARTAHHIYTHSLQFHEGRTACNSMKNGLRFHEGPYCLPHIYA